jgi:hypothetical protein
LSPDSTYQLSGRNPRKPVTVICLAGLAQIGNGVCIHSGRRVEEGPKDVRARGKALTREAEAATRLSAAPMGTVFLKRSRLIATAAHLSAKDFVQ